MNAIDFYIKEKNLFVVQRVHLLASLCVLQSSSSPGHVAQSIGAVSLHIPKGCGLIPGQGHLGSSQLMFLSHFDVSLSLSCSLSLLYKSIF